jgi:hypothetical protein
MLLGLALLGAAAYSEWQDAGRKGIKPAVNIVQANIPEPSRPAIRNVTSVAEIEDVKLDGLGKRGISNEKIINVFEKKTWFIPPPPPPPPPKPKPVPPPAPVAPPLPYAYLGSYQEPGGHLIIFLTKGERMYSVSPGDTLESVYRVDGIVGVQLSLTYLPLNTKQTINIGESS